MARHKTKKKPRYLWLADIESPYVKSQKFRKVPTKIPTKRKVSPPTYANCGQFNAANTSASAGAGLDLERRRPNLGGTASSASKAHQCSRLMASKLRASCAALAALLLCRCGRTLALRGSVSTRAGLLWWCCVWAFDVPGKFPAPPFQLIRLASAKSLAGLC